MVIYKRSYGDIEHAFETSVFKYTTKQFVMLRKVSLALSSVSLASSVIIASIFIYMLIRHRQRANRVSLRCVFLCSIADIINSILSICITKEKGDSQFCRAAGVVIEFANIWSATILTLVGLNLVLIFVINVKRRDLLEKLYYPCAIVYTFVGVAVPIYQQVNADSKEYRRLTCWYLKYVKDRTYNLFPWMWCYAFIFFVNVVAVICSMVALIKLVHEQRLLESNMHTIHTNSAFSNQNTSNQLNKRVKDRHNTVFTKVVLRCIFYPLVPFLVNFFGFILQMYITATDHLPTFTLAMLDIIFCSIEGVFVLIIFFTDPAITTFMESAYTDLYEKYVDQYILVPKDEPKEKTSTPPSIDASSSPSMESGLQSPSAAVYNQNLRSASAYNNHRAKYEDEQKGHHHSSNNVQTVAMRRLQYERSPHIRKNQQSRISTNCRTSAPPPARTRNNEYQHTPLTATRSNTRDLYVPYRCPFFATCLHHILRLIGHKKNRQAKEKQETNQCIPSLSANNAIEKDVSITEHNIPSSTNSDSVSSTVVAAEQDKDVEIGHLNIEEIIVDSDIDISQDTEDDGRASFSTISTQHF